MDIIKSSSFRASNTTVNCTDDMVRATIDFTHREWVEFPGRMMAQPGKGGQSENVSQHTHGEIRPVCALTCENSGIDVALERNANAPRSAEEKYTSTNSAMVPCPKCGGNVWKELIKCSNCKYEFNWRLAQHQ